MKVSKYIMLSMIAGLFMSSGMQTVERHPGEYGEGETKARLIKKPAAKQSIQTQLDYIFAADSVPKLTTFITKNPTFDWTSPQINLLFPNVATTPLMSAAWHNAIKCITYLFNENIGNIKSSILTKDSSGQTAETYALSKKSDLAYNFLVPFGNKALAKRRESAIHLHLDPQIAQPNPATIASVKKNIASTHKNMLKLVDEIAGNNLATKAQLLQNILRHELQSQASLEAYKQPARAEVSATLEEHAMLLSQGGGQFPGCPYCE